MEIINHKGKYYLKTETGYREVLATTDASLLIDTYINQGDTVKGDLIIKRGSDYTTELKGRINLPQPSQQFIQKYIEEYNKGNIITDVLVEYEIKSNAGLGHNEWVYLQHIEGKRYVPIKIEANNQDIYQLGKEDTFEDYELECNLKVNLTDNTITIKKAKDSYTREEVDRMLDEQASKTTAEMMEKFKDYKSREEIKSLLFKFTNHFDLKRNIEITLDMQSKWLEENL